jgi:fatty acid desaturase
MASGAASDLDARDMGTSALPGRAALDIAFVRTLSRRSNLQGWMRWIAHLLVIGITGALVWLARPYWFLLVPAMVLHGFALVTMFAPMHECVHRTAFASPLANEIVGWIAGLLSFYNFTYYRHYHTWHHRYTQDPERDPELMTPKPGNMAGYLWEISGASFWLNRPSLFLGMALGHTGHLPYVPASARWKIAISAGLQLAIYVAAVISIVLGYRFALYFWFLPVLLAQPLLRAILIAEHTGCTTDDNGLTNTRTTLTNALVRLLMWNMPFHTEHHLYPSIPFHQLPQAHLALKERLAHLAPSYVAANREVIESLGATP